MGVILITLATEPNQLAGQQRSSRHEQQRAGRERNQEHHSRDMPRVQLARPRSLGNSVGIHGEDVVLHSLHASIDFRYGG